MPRHLIARVTSFGALAATLLLAAASTRAQTASGDCDRACLRQLLDAYLSAVFKHDPGAAALTDDHYATEDTVVVRSGEGFWKNISGYGALQRRYFDPVYETAAYYGLLKENGQDTITSLRIRVKDKKVSEAEWIMGRSGDAGHGVADPQGVVKYPAPEGTLPAAQRSSRFVMISIANDYFQAVREGNGSWVPNDPNCLRVENGGGGMHGDRPRSAEEEYAATHPMGGCVHFTRVNPMMKDVGLRRIPLVDEEAGVVLGTAIFSFSNLATNVLVSDFFQIKDGKLVNLWIVFDHDMPTQTGWEGR